MARARLRRLGKFNRIVNPGLHFLISFIERRAANINLRTQEARYSLNGKTKDNVTIGTAVSVQFRVDQMPAQSVEQSGVYRSYYILSNPIDQMESYIADALRSAIPGYTLDEVFDNKDLIAQNVKDSVTELMAGYGYDIITTLITNIELSKDVERSMNAINSAQRDQEAAKALAEAERTKTVVAARAQAEAMEQTDIGIANQRKAIADGIAASLRRKSSVSPSYLTEYASLRPGTRVRSGAASTRSALRLFAVPVVDLALCSLCAKIYRCLLRYWKEPHVRSFKVGYHQTSQGRSGR